MSAVKKTRISAILWMVCAVGNDAMALMRGVNGQWGFVALHLIAATACMVQGVVCWVKAKKIEDRTKKEPWE